jgi:hypothetical protein
VLSIPLPAILDLLRSIERGAVVLTALDEPQRIYAGIVAYAADNGWRLAIYNDCNEWDYIDWVEAPDGRRVEYEGIDATPELRAYEPSEAVAWSRYGLPGHSRFRCTGCGRDMKHLRGVNGLRCSECRATAR